MFKKNSMLQRNLIRVFIFLVTLGVGITASVYHFQPYVSILVEADREIPLYLFFDNGKTEEYRFDDQHMTAAYPISTVQQTIRIDLPLEGINRLRLDFGNEPCIVSIHRLRLVISPTRMIELEGANLQQRFAERQDIASCDEREDGSIQFHVSGQDGYIAATEDFVSEDNLSLNPEFFQSLCFIFGAALLLCCMDYFVIAIRRLVRLCGKLGLTRIYFKPENRAEVFIGAACSVGAAFLGAVILDGMVLKLILWGARALGMDTLSRYFAAASEFSWGRTFFFFHLLLILSLCIWLGKNKAEKYRYVLALLLLALMTAGQYTGSSIGYYDNMLQGNTEEYRESTLLGIPQGIRGDEWATEKPYYFAQVNGDVKLPYYNNNLMIDGADMVVSAFAPVKDPILVFRPSLLGFLFLPAANAFAFYWWWKIIALFMGAFEICRLLSGRSYYGVIGAFVFLFAPPSQWWMSQAVIEMIAFGFYALTAYEGFLSGKIRWKRCLKLVITFYCLTGYILTMYPANQVPFAYIFLAILIWILSKNWCRKPFSLRKLALYLITAVPFVGMLVRFALMSGDAIRAELNTIYPGQSRAWIPLTKHYPFYRLINLFIANIRHPDFLNACEISQFYSFAVILIPFMVWLLRRSRKRQELFLPGILFCFSTFLLVVTWLPQIPILNQITLLSMTYPVRITIAYGMGYTLTLIALLPVLERTLQGVAPQNAKVICGAGGFCVLCIATNIQEVFDYVKAFRFGPFLLVMVILLFSYMAYLLITGGKCACRRFAVLLAALNLVSTACVNPITQGTDSMFEKTTMRAIRQMNKESPGRWMVSGSPTISNLVTAQGVARASGTYYYPDWTMMQIIDPERQFEQYWNQYAHIDMRLTDGSTNIETFDHERSQKVNGVNRIVYVSFDVVKKLGIKYIFTSVDVPESLLTGGRLTLRYEDPVDLWKIYEVISDE